MSREDRSRSAAQQGGARRAPARSAAPRLRDTPGPAAADPRPTSAAARRDHPGHERPPRQAAFDGGFASKDNLKWAKGKGIKDVAFAKKRGLKVENMVRSSWVYKQLRRFRAGIEGCISTLKRVFGLRRCGWSGWAHFQQYVQLSVVTFNLVVLARLLL